MENGGVGGGQGVVGGTAVAAVVELVAVDDVLGLLVGETVVGVDDGLAEPLFFYVGIGIELEEDGEGEPVFVGTEGAEVVAEPFREHGDGAVNEVDAGAAEVGFVVDGRAGTDEMGDVGDVDAHFVVAVRKRAEGEGVVEVFGIGWVDGEGGDGAEVAAVFEVFGGGGGEGVGLSRYLLGEVEREVVFGEDGEHLDVVVAWAAEPFDDFADGVVHTVGPVGHLDDDLVAVLGAVEVGERDEYIDGHGAAVADHEGKTLLELDAADETSASPLEYLDHLAFGFVHLALWKHHHLDGVAVECVAGVARGNLDVVAVLVARNDIGLAALVHVDGADDVVFGKEFVGEVLGVEFESAFVVGLDEDFFFDQLLHGGDDGLTAAFVMSTYPGCNLLVVECVERIAGKDLYDRFGVVFHLDN